MPHLTMRAVLGGGGAVNGADPISIGTAYLYSEFAKGTLQDYAFAGTEAEREASAALLQNAIWYLEKEGGRGRGWFFAIGYTKSFRMMLLLTIMVNSMLLY